MIRFLLRVLGVWLFAGALVLATVDATKSIAADTVVTTSLGDTLAGLAGGPPTAESTGLPPALWSVAQAIAIDRPAAIVLAAVALILLALSRRRRRITLGYETA